MSLEYPEDLKYLDSHEYVRLEGEIATIGVSAFAVRELGEVVFVELPEVNDTVTRNERFGSIESVKAVEELNSPVTGTVIERNDSIIDDPEAVSDDPYGEGWLLKVRVNDPDDIDDTLTAKEYGALVTGV
ncbi:glycine cleavage system protein GcvH [Scytonema hofmannii FACHB-248]|uniref:Glycine cleavage system H protein n=1 Tax=Scytonema hofmannii FACHB-248 TaxID=1842502 RepID=A0ABR8H0W8_9CYAN|nr:MULTISPECIES: glycine cleavage system protein GcvH [Nostocales]MBD2609465.1 glycine cleavage system protein GcvH [Scytonema hofmannii FACHB-248]